MAASDDELRKLRQECASLQSRVRDLESKVQRTQGSDGIAVHGNVLRRTPNAEDRLLRLDIDNLKRLLNWWDLTVYDVDEETVLHAGTRQLIINDGTGDREIFWFKDTFCKDGTDYSVIDLRSHSF